jgi:hypothetical protein
LFHEFIEEISKELENEEKFLSMLKSFLEIKIPHSSKSDLYYWIKILDFIDEYMARIITQIKKTPSAESQELYDKLNIVLDFTLHLVQNASSRIIYNSIEVNYIPTIFSTNFYSSI